MSYPSTSTCAGPQPSICPIDYWAFNAHVPQQPWMNTAMSPHGQFPTIALPSQYIEPPVQYINASIPFQYPSHSILSQLSPRYTVMSGPSSSTCCWPQSPRATALAPALGPASPNQTRARVLSASDVPKSILSIPIECQGSPRTHRVLSLQGSPLGVMQFCPLQYSGPLTPRQDAASLAPLRTPPNVTPRGRPPSQQTQSSAKRALSLDTGTRRSTVESARVTASKMTASADESQVHAELKDEMSQLRSELVSLRQELALLRQAVYTSPVAPAPTYDIPLGQRLHHKESDLGEALKRLDQRLQETQYFDSALESAEVSKVNLSAILRTTSLGPPAPQPPMLQSDAAVDSLPSQLLPLKYVDAGVAVMDIVDDTHSASLGSPVGSVAKEYLVPLPPAMTPAEHQGAIRAVRTASHPTSYSTFISPLHEPEGVLHSRSPSISASITNTGSASASILTQGLEVDGTVNDVGALDREFRPISLGVHWVEAEAGTSPTPSTGQSINRLYL